VNGLGGVFVLWEDVWCVGSVLGSVMGVWRWNDWRMMVVHIVPVDYLTFEQFELG